MDIVYTNKSLKTATTKIHTKKQIKGTHKSLGIWRAK